MSDFIKLRITEKNSVGEYWLHFSCRQQEAGINIGNPAGMMSSAFLMAASGKSYVPTDAPALLALVDAAKGVMRHMPDHADTAWQDLAEAIAAYEAAQ